MTHLTLYRSLAFLCFVILSTAAAAVAFAQDTASPFQGLLVSEQEIIQKKGWDKKSGIELQQELQKIQSDLSLIQKRLDDLRGKTRLNQDQYREKEILDELSFIRQNELTILSRLIHVSDLAPDFRLSSTLGREISLQEFRNKKNVLLVFYLFDFSPT